MVQLTVYDRTNVQVSSAGLKLIVPPNVGIKIVVDLPKEVEKEAQVDKVLMRKFTEQAEAIMKQTITMIEKKCKIFEALFQGMIDNGEKQSVIDKNLDGLNKALKQDVEVAQIAAEQGVDAAWQDLAKKRSDWKKHKIKVAATILVSLAKLAVTVTLVVLSGGTVTAAGVLTTINSVTTILKEVYRLNQDIEAARKSLESDLTQVEKNAESSGLYVAKEIANETLRAFLGASRASLKSCEKGYQTLKSKLDHMVVTCHDVSKDLTRLEKERAKMDREFKADVQKALKGIPVSNGPAQEAKIVAAYAKKFTKSDDAISDATETMNDLYNQSKDWSKTVDAMGQRFDDLAINDPAALKVFRVAIRAISVGLAAITNPAAAGKAFDDAVSLGKVAANFDYGKAVGEAIDGTALQFARI